MKYVKMTTVGLVLWSLTLVWPEINLALLPTAGLTWALISLIGLYLLLTRRCVTPRRLAAAYVHSTSRSDAFGSGHSDSLHTRPTQPYPVSADRSRDSRPSRPVPQL